LTDRDSEQFARLFPWAAILFVVWVSLGIWWADPRHHDPYAGPQSLVLLGAGLFYRLLFAGRVTGRSGSHREAVRWCATASMLAIAFLVGTSRLPQALALAFPLFLMPHTRDRFVEEAGLDASASGVFLSIFKLALMLLTVFSSSLGGWTWLSPVLGVALALPPLVSRRRARVA
jgi:hypothetical protein